MKYAERFSLGIFTTTSTAAPIHRPGDTLIIALALNGPSARIPVARVPVFGAAVRDTTDHIGTSLRS